MGSSCSTENSQMQNDNAISSSSPSSNPPVVKFADQVDMHTRSKQRGKNVFSKSLTTKMNAPFKAPFFAKSQADLFVISSAISDNFIFSSLSAEERELFISAMEPVHYPANHSVIKQGDELEDDQYFYIVSSGKVDFLIDGKKVGSCETGRSFGELAREYKYKTLTFTASISMSTSTITSTNLPPPPPKTQHPPSPLQLPTRRNLHHHDLHHPVSRGPSHLPPSPCWFKPAWREQHC